MPIEFMSRLAQIRPRHFIVANAALCIAAELAWVAYWASHPYPRLGDPFANILETYLFFVTPLLMVFSVTGGLLGFVVFFRIMHRFLGMESHYEGSKGIFANVFGWPSGVKNPQLLSARGKYHRERLFSAKSWLVTWLGFAAISLLLAIPLLLQRGI